MPRELAPQQAFSNHLRIEGQRYAEQTLKPLVSSGPFALC